MCGHTRVLAICLSFLRVLFSLHVVTVRTVFRIVLIIPSVHAGRLKA
jgi:hypothetical protein